MRGDGTNAWQDITPPKISAPAQGSANSAALGFAIVVDPSISALDVVVSGMDYEIRTAPDGGGTVVYSVVNSPSLLGVVVPVGVVSGLQAGQTYYLRVRAKSIGGLTSTFGPDIRITT